MEIKTESKKDRIVVTMTFNKPEWDTAIDTAYKKTASKYTVQGFRAGKAPRKMIEQQYGENIFTEEAIHGLFTNNFEKFLNENKKIRLTDYPHLDFNLAKDGGINLIVTCDIEPEVRLGKYTGLEIEKTEIKVDDKDAEEYLNRMRETRAKQVAADKDYKIANGDIAVIDFKGSVDGKYFEGGEDKNHELEIGSGSFIDNFEDQLIGLKIGDAKDVFVTFPKEYHAENLKGAKAKFEVKVNNILRKVLPVIDDQFAKEVSEFNTLAEFKTDIKNKMREQAVKQAELADGDKLFNVIVDNASVDIPDIMVEKHLDEVMDDMEQKLKAQGAGLEMYAGYRGTTVEKMRAEQKQIAARQVKMRLVMDAIIEKEGLTDKERHKQFDKLNEFLKNNNIIK
jgi:trigger factor